MGFLSEKKNDRPIVGIDLGTTNTVAAVMRGSEPVVVRSESGSATIPSIVHLGEPEVVGERARPFLESDPKNTVFASKRLIGRKHADPEIQDFLKAVPFATTASCNGDVWIKTDSGRFSPTQIGAKILSHVKKFTEKWLGGNVSRAVITVPAYFDDCQKQATRDAGRIAGLEVVRIINEPTAAALAYGLDRRASGHVAVYDLGGGTFDVSILELADGIFRVKATNGHTFLGGEDFDSEFAHFLARQFEQGEGVAVRAESFSRLRRAAEDAKKRLSTETQARVYIEDFQDGLDLDVKVSREQLEAVVMKLANKTVGPCKQAIADAGLERGDVKHVVLVGGMTRMPAIRRLAADVFGGKLETGVDPDEAVALGAAVQAGVLAGKIDNVLLLDVAPLSLGIEVAGGVFSKVVDRNTTLPFKRTESFTTSLDNQEHVDIRVFQGERPMVADNRLLGSIRLINLPKVPRGVPRIEVTFEADANGITKVSARDAATGKQQELVVSPASGLTETQVQKMIKEAEENAASDARNAELAEFREKTTRLLAEWESRALPEDVAGKLDELRGLLQTDVEKARQVLEGLQAVL